MATRKNAGGDAHSVEGQRVKRVEVPEIKLARMVVTIRGITPLITNRFREDAKQQIEDKQQGKAKMVKPPRTPEQEYREALHVVGKERYGFPAAGIKSSLVSAGGRFADETMTVLRGVINIPADLLEIKGSKPTMRSDFVRLNNGQGPASIAYRPMFEQWTIDVPVVFMANMTTQEQVLNLFRIAGFSVGIGAWRTEKRGSFGQFEVAGAKG